MLLVALLPDLQPVGKRLSLLTSLTVTHFTGAFEILEGKMRSFQLELDLPSDKVEFWVPGIDLYRLIDRFKG